MFPRMDPGLRASALAGALAGVVGLALFTLLHAVLIVPMWDILAIAALPAALGGLAIGWAFDELLRRGKLPARPWQGIAFGALMFLPLAAVELATFALGPVPVDRIDGGQFTLELLAAVPVGVVLGLALTRDARGALVLGLAALVLALTIGHNIPFFAVTGWAGQRMTLVMLAVVLASGLLLAEARPRLRGGKA